MSFKDKVIPVSILPTWRRTIGKRLKLVVTNGCFDMLHIGHATYLEQARECGDVLLVGINSDRSVRELKGPARPTIDEQDRALMVAALESVDAVCIFDEKTAEWFLRYARPNVYVKGGDYTLATLNPEERQTVQASMADIVFIPLVPGKSTTLLLEKLNQAQP